MVHVLTTSSANSGVVYPNNDIAYGNYNNTLWFLCPLLFMWWLPLLALVLFGFYKGGSSTGYVDTTTTTTVPGTTPTTMVTSAGATGSRWSTWSDRFRNMARAGRDAFLTLGVLLLASIFIFGGVIKGVYIATWIAFIAAVIFWFGAFSVKGNVFIRILVALSILTFVVAALYILFKSFLAIADCDFRDPDRYYTLYIYQ